MDKSTKDSSESRDVDNSSEDYRDTEAYRFFVEVTLKKTEVAVELCKTIIGVSSAFLAFTAAFLKANTFNPVALYVCWVLLVIAVAASVIRLYFLDRFMSRFARVRHKIAQDKGFKHLFDSKENLWSSRARSLSILFFILSLATFVVAMIIGSG